MRIGSHAPIGPASAKHTPGAPSPNLRDAHAVAELFLGVFRRDLALFYPQTKLQLEEDQGEDQANGGPDFRLIEGENGGVFAELFGLRYRLESGDGRHFSPADVRMIRAVGAVLSLRYQHLFQITHPTRLELYRGGSEDHYIAAFVEPWVYNATESRPSRIASTIHTLRTAALSTYENRRVSTGALLLGQEDELPRPISPDALPYGVELTSLKSIHRLCDGKRTLFLVDRVGKLVEVIDIERWADRFAAVGPPDLPCARDYTAHARATRTGGRLCIVLSPNQEIKLFAQGAQAFAFSHGRWRILDASSKYAVWSSAVAEPRLARVLYQTALDLAECRQGGLFVVIDNPDSAIDRLIAPHDLLSDATLDGPPSGFRPGDPLAKRALHYLARGRSIVELDPPVLEALAGLDGAIATDRSGRLLAFGAILRHDASASTGLAVEGARTTAALIASRHGPVLKVSEDGVVSCFLDGARAWDL